MNGIKFLSLFQGEEKLLRASVNFDPKQAYRRNLESQNFYNHLVWLINLSLIHI